MKKNKKKTNNNTLEKAASIEADIKQLNQLNHCLKTKEEDLCFCSNHAEIAANSSRRIVFSKFTT